ncbi:DUF7660 family protein [Aliikangiella sp. IMCC44632]
MKELHELAEEVSDQETFLVFVRALYKDRERSSKSENKSPSSPYEADAGGWENTSIETFFEAAVAWAEDSSFGTKMAFPEYQLDGQNPWRSFAAFLLAGKVYE